MGLLESSQTGLTTPISDNEFQLSLPLNQIWKHQTSYVDVQIGIGYNNARYKYGELVLYDSKCRYCDNGALNNEEIKVSSVLIHYKTIFLSYFFQPNTCLINNVCYLDGESKPNDEDYICDVTEDVFDWTFIGISRDKILECCFK